MPWLFFYFIICGRFTRIDQQAATIRHQNQGAFFTNTR
jgi:hypothetical protein